MKKLNPIKDYETSFFFVGSKEHRESIYDSSLSTVFPCASVVASTYKLSVERFLIQESYWYWINKEVEYFYKPLFLITNKKIKQIKQ